MLLASAFGRLNKEELFKNEQLDKWRRILSAINVRNEGEGSFSKASAQPRSNSRANGLARSSKASSALHFILGHGWYALVVWSPSCAAPRIISALVCHWALSAPYVKTFSYKDLSAAARQTLGCPTNIAARSNDPTGKLKPIFGIAHIATSE